MVPQDTVRWMVWATDPPDFCPLLHPLGDRAASWCFGWLSPLRPDTRDAFHVCGQSDRPLVLYWPPGESRSPVGAAFLWPGPAICTCGINVGCWGSRLWGVGGLLMLGHYGCNRLRNSSRCLFCKSENLPRWKNAFASDVGQRENLDAITWVVLVVLTPSEKQERLSSVWRADSEPGNKCFMINKRLW